MDRDPCSRSNEDRIGAAAYQGQAITTAPWPGSVPRHAAADVIASVTACPDLWPRQVEITPIGRYLRAELLPR